MKNIIINLEKEEVEVNVYEYEKFDLSDLQLLDELIDWLKCKEN